MPRRKRTEKITTFADRKQYVQFRAVMHREYEFAVKNTRGGFPGDEPYDPACGTLADIGQKIEPFIKNALLKLQEKIGRDSQ
mgnify:CR=1 FL=1